MARAIEIVGIPKPDKMDINEQDSILVSLLEFVEEYYLAEDKN